MSMLSRHKRSLWHSALGVGSVAALVVAVKVSLRKFIAVGAAWMVGFSAGTSLTTMNAQELVHDEPLPGTAPRYCNGAEKEASCISVLDTFLGD